MGVYDGNLPSANIKLYVDGNLQSTTYNQTIDIPNTADSETIGALKGSAVAYYFPGIIDEVRVDNTARTADQIRQAYQYGLRAHQITIDFLASLDSGNLITNSSDTSFTIDATTKGLSQKGSNLYVGDKIIVKENYNGTEYIAQGTINTVNISTGVVTVESWDTGATFPSGGQTGFSVNADVFKWQREFWDISDISSGDKDEITKLGVRVLDASEGFDFYLDDFKTNGNYLTNPLGGETITSTPQRYFQYKAIFSTNDTIVTPALTSVTLDLHHQPNPYSSNFFID